MPVFADLCAHGMQICGPVSQNEKEKERAPPNSARNLSKTVRKSFAVPMKRERRGVMDARLYPRRGLPTRPPSAGRRHRPPPAISRRRGGSKMADKGGACAVARKGKKKEVSFSAAAAGRPACALGFSFGGVPFLSCSQIAGGLEMV